RSRRCGALRRWYGSEVSGKKHVCASSLPPPKQPHADYPSCKPPPHLRRVPFRGVRGSRCTLRTRDTAPSAAAWHRAHSRSVALVHARPLRWSPSVSDSTAAAVRDSATPNPSSRPADHEPIYKTRDRPTEDIDRPFSRHRTPPRPEHPFPAGSEASPATPARLLQ